MAMFIILAGLLAAVLIQDPIAITIGIGLAVVLNWLELKHLEDLVIKMKNGDA